MPFTFVFKDNRGHDYTDDPLEERPDNWTVAQIKKAKLLHTSQPNLWQESTTKHTDAQGQMTISVLSSDVISKPILEVYWTDAQQNQVLVGSVLCDFGEATSIRRFPNQYDPEEEEDLGWLFDAPRLASQNDVTPAKMYLKFMVDRQLGNISGNWKFVNNHKILLSVTGVYLPDGTMVTSTPVELKKYAAVMSQNNPNGVPELLVQRDTTSQGETPQVYVVAGDEIANVAQVVVGARNMSQFEE